MKINFLQEAALQTLKGNITANKDHYKEADNSWVKDLFKDEPCFSEFKYEVEDFELYTDEEKPERTDFENIKRLYSNLSFLTETQATDERLWAGLAHDKFWTYMQYRWPVHNQDDIEKSVKRWYFFGESRRRSLTFHGLAKLWWIGKYTYDERREDPFEITAYICRDLATFSMYLFSSNLMSSQPVRMGIFTAILDMEKAGHPIRRNAFNEIIKYFNILGGTSILDLFTEEEIYDKAMRQFKKMLQE